eukprot:7632500-Ditylum_brightwellii.AAC.1
MGLVILVCGPFLKMEKGVQSTSLCDGLQLKSKKKSETYGLKANAFNFIKLQQVSYNVTM